MKTGRKVDEIGNEVSRQEWSELFSLISWKSMTYGWDSLVAAVGYRPMHLVGYRPVEEHSVWVERKVVDATLGTTVEEEGEMCDAPRCLQMCSECELSLTGCHSDRTTRDWCWGQRCDEPE